MGPLLVNWKMHTGSVLSFVIYHLLFNEPPARQENLNCAILFCRNPSSREHHSFTLSIASTNSLEVQVRSLVLEKQQDRQRRPSVLHLPLLRVHSCLWYGVHVRTSSGVRLQSDISGEKVRALSETCVRLQGGKSCQTYDRGVAETFCLFICKCSKLSTVL